MPKNQFVIDRKKEVVTRLSPSFPTKQGLAIHPLSTHLTFIPDPTQPRTTPITTLPDTLLPFIHDTHAIYMALQSILSVSTTPEGLVRTSSLYREAILRQVQEDSPQTDTLHSIHAIWHLFEIIYLTAPNQPVVPHLLEWLNFNFPAPLADQGQQLIVGAPTDQQLAENPQIWPYMKKLALRGHLNILANMLDRISATHTECKQLAQVLREMPMASAELSKSFAPRWRQWNQALQNIQTTGELSEIMDILRGDADAISAESETWQDILGALLLYSEPTAKADRLPALVKLILEQFEASSLSKLDRALASLFTHEVPECLVLANQIDPWLPAHLSDIMHHLDILRSTCQQGFQINPRHYYIQALGELYMGHSNLWRIGIDYLSTVGCTEVMEEYIMRIPLDSNTMTQKVLRTCDQYQLTYAQDRIHRQRGRQMWEQQKWAQAISHFAEVKDDLMISQICGQLWKQHRGAYGDVLECINYRHHGLQFLAKYREFQEFLRTGKLLEAAQVLLGILVGELAPAYAVADLLVDCIPLLEGDQIVFGADDTLELLRFAQQTPATDMDPSEQSIFNMACARNLARAFVTQ